MSEMREKDAVKIISKGDLILITLGLIGSVLLWMGVDPGGWLIYFSFLLFGIQRVSIFFSLNPYQRNRTQIVKFVFSALIIITVITHILWGGQPLFGVLAALVLVYSVTNMETEEKRMRKSESQ